MVLCGCSTAGSTSFDPKFEDFQEARNYCCGVLEARARERTEDARQDSSVAALAHPTHYTTQTSDMTEITNTTKGGD